jgi:hypothetical protein
VLTVPNQLRVLEIVLTLHDHIELVLVLMLTVPNQLRVLEIVLAVHDHIRALELITPMNSS